MMYFRGQTSGLPSGSIVLWSGSVGSIPAGFYLCNGSNGTPDLRSKFLIGAGGAYAVGNMGGDTSHFHAGESSHIHAIPAGSAISVGGEYDEYTGEPEAVGNTSTSNHLPPYYALCYIMKA